MMAISVFWLGFVASACLVGLLARFAPGLGLVDHPGGHKHHARPVPVVGGIGLALATFILALWLAASGRITAQEHHALWIAALMLGLGLWDDRLALTPRIRFVLQALAAIAMARYAGAVLYDLGALFDGRHLLVLGWFAWPMTVFSMVGVMNACNMSDGMDGAAGTLSLLAILGALLLSPALAGKELLLLLAAAILGFLVWNLPLRGAARVYLGDAGSLFLGILLAWMLVSMSQGASRAFSPVAALWLYALPLIDTVSVMWRRMAEHRSPFQPDQRHIHHLLLRAGLSVRQSWLVLTVLAAVGVGLGVCATRAGLPEPLLAAGFLLVAFVHHGLVRSADRHGRLLGKRLSPDVASARVRGASPVDTRA